ncbi:ankyrin repeat-containing domain protein, partial [Obelidium mucronatum]
MVRKTPNYGLVEPWLAATSIHMLPYDILVGIVRNLPLDAHLIAVGLASKATLAPIIFNNIHFARAHFKHLLQSSSHSFWHYLHIKHHCNVSQIETNLCPQFIGDLSYVEQTPFILPESPAEAWECLPLNYKAALYGEILMHPEWDGVVPPETRTAALEIKNGFFWNDRCESNQDIMRPVYWEMPEREAVVVMQKLLESRVGGFSADCQRNRPLRWAARNGHVEVVQLLLSACDEWDDSIVAILNDRNALNSLDIACAYGRYLIAEILLQDSRVTKEACDMAYSFGSLKRDVSPFGRNYAHVIRVLLEDGRAEPSLPWRHHFYADAVEFLLKDGRYPITNDGRALMNAAETGNLAMVKYFLGLPGLGVLPVVPAAKHGQVHIMEYLLSLPEIDPSVYYNEAIRQASANGHFEIVQMLLLDSRVDPSMPGLARVFGASRYYEFQDFPNTALHLAIRGGHTRVVQLLLAYLDTVFEDGSSSVSNAVNRGEVKRTNFARGDGWYADPYIEKVVRLLLDDKRMVDHIVRIRERLDLSKNHRINRDLRRKRMFYVKLAEDKGKLEIAEH